MDKFLLGENRNGRTLKAVDNVDLKGAVTVKRLPPLRKTFLVYTGTVCKLHEGRAPSHTGLQIIKNIKSSQMQRLN